MPDGEAQVGALWMVGLGLNRAKASPDNAVEGFQKGTGWN